MKKENSDYFQLFLLFLSLQLFSNPTNFPIKIDNHKAQTEVC